MRRTQGSGYGCVMVLLAALLAIPGLGCDAPMTQAAPASDAPLQQAVDPEAQRLLRRAAAALERHRTISARIRQTVDLYGHKLVGSGSYQQMQNPSADQPARVLSRIELRLQVRERTATWEQVCDGRTLWTFRKVPDVETDELGNTERGYSRQTRWVDLSQVVEKVGETPPTVVGIAAWGLGGLPRVLASLGRSFEFERLRTEQISGVPLWVVDGRWKPHELLRLLPSQADAIRSGQPDLSQLAPRLPDSVSIYLGKEDLFPFRIAYRRWDPESQTRTTLVNIELYEVSFDTKPDARRFKVIRGKKDEDDDTARFLQLYRDAARESR